MARYTSNQAKEIFASNLTRLMGERGMDGAALARVVGVEKQSVYSWLKRRSYPTANTIQRLVDALGVSVDELLTEGGPTAESELSAQERELVRAARAAMDGGRYAYYVMNLDTGEMKRLD